MVLKILPKVSNINSIRNFVTQRSSLEVKIPISGGYMSGKWWGPEDRRPILALHGWQDNCGSFDRLIPLLPPHIPVLALDYLGHGFSSQIPPGMIYHDIDHCIHVKQIKNYFGWKKMSLMGHSMGGIVTYLYGSLFPNELDFAISIDRLFPILTNQKDTVPQTIEDNIRYDEINNRSGEPPSYTFEEIVKKTHLGSKKSIDIEVAKYVIYRNISPSKKSPGRFYFSRDARLKSGPIDFHDPAEILSVASKITFPFFVARSRDSAFFGRHPVINDLREVLKNSNKDFQFHEVPGTHHTHLNDPHILGELITEFLLKHNRGDRSIGGLKPDLKVDESVYPIYKYKKQILD